MELLSSTYIIVYSTCIQLTKVTKKIILELVWKLNGMCVVEGNSNDFARPGYYYQCDSLSSKVEESHN